jgi:hypothetical protein
MSAPTCNISRSAPCTTSGIESTIDSLCDRFIGDEKTLDAGSQLVGDTYNVGEHYGLSAMFTVRATGITLTRATCLETLKFVQEECVIIRPGDQCASGQAVSTDGNFVVSITFS